MASTEDEGGGAVVDGAGASVMVLILSMKQAVDL